MKLLYSLSTQSTIPFSKIIKITSLTISEINLNLDYNICKNLSKILKAARARNFREVKRLLQAGGDVNTKYRTGDKRSVLHYAAKSGSLEIVKYLVKHGANVNCKNKWNNSVLYNAAMSGSLEIIKCLVEHGADVNSKTKEGASVFHYAANSCSLEVVKCLVEHGADQIVRTTGILYLSSLLCCYVWLIGNCQIFS